MCPAGCIGSGQVSATKPSLRYYYYTDGRCPVFGAQTPYGCNESFPAAKPNQYCRKCYPTHVFTELAFTEFGIYGDDTSGQTKNSTISMFPICPPCVCEHYGLDPEQCADETVPESESFKELVLSLDGKNRTVRYVSNRWANPQA